MCCYVFTNTERYTAELPLRMVSVAPDPRGVVRVPAVVVLSFRGEVQLQNRPLLTRLVTLCDVDMAGVITPISGSFLALQGIGGKEEKIEI